MKTLKQFLAEKIEDYISDVGFSVANIYSTELAQIMIDAQEEWWILEREKNMESHAYESYR